MSFDIEKDEPAFAIAHHEVIRLRPDWHFFEDELVQGGA